MWARPSPRPPGPAVLTWEVAWGCLTHSSCPALVLPPAQRMEAMEAFPSLEFGNYTASDEAHVAQALLSGRAGFIFLFKQLCGLGQITSLS